ncbi:hypothetical protein L3Q82_016491 [Scortum barcoo]|uniref:Uncharacterized protein n=1 Tax=Scortum barcoo TaxID=214431 RepID=A0ACB8X8V3_9TELE|nr:hypothetical protein L3Q82_016491 [Scortum barcoo]
MIDFIIVSSDLQPYVLDTLVKRGAEMSTDHHLVGRFGHEHNTTNSGPRTSGLLLGRLQLLRTPDWRRSCCRRTEGKRKQCARKQKRGKRGGLLARLKANAGRPPIPSLFLSNVRSLDNKLDLLRLRLGVSREMRNCSVLCLTETWLNDNMPDPAFQLDGRLLFRADRNQQSGKAPTGADYASM